MLAQSGQPAKAVTKHKWKMTMARINAQLFTDLLNGLFAKLAKAEAADVSGGVISYNLGGKRISHSVHVAVTFDGKVYYVSFASDTPISIDKRLFESNPEISTERSRMQLVAQIDEIRKWQQDRMNEGIVLEFSYPEVQRPRKPQAVVVIDSSPSVQRPVKPALLKVVGDAAKPAKETAPLPSKPQVPAALQRGARVGS